MDDGNNTPKEKMVSDIVMVDVNKKFNLYKLLRMLLMKDKPSFNYNNKDILNCQTATGRNLMKLLPHDICYLMEFLNDEGKSLSFTIKSSAPHTLSNTTTGRSGYGMQIEY